MGATGYKILDLAISANTPDGNTWFEITQKVSGVNVSKRISAPTLAAYFAPDLSAYLTSATAAATYVPLTRNLTINGTTYNLSADRSWTIPTGGNETLAQTLALGNTSGANDIVMSTTQEIVFMDGDNTYYTAISNDQSQAGNRIVYLPTYTGQLAYHAAGVPLVSGRITFATTNGALTDSANFLWDNSNYRLGVGNGVSSSATIHAKGSTADSTSYILKLDSSGSSARLWVRADGAFWVNTNAGDGKFHFQDGDFRIYDGANKRMVLLQNGRLTYGATTINSRFHFYDPNATASEDAIMVETNYSTTSYSARYTAFKGLNTSMANNDVFRVIGGSDSQSYDLGAMFIKKTASGEGAWHITARAASTLNLGLVVYGNGTLAMPGLQVGNSGLSSGDLYKDTAANILTNGDYVIGMKA